jgi:N-acetylglucosaminyldiphosphoundecaprenol N-acetyl-beta-D-mannosaminyltransferase
MSAQTDSRPARDVLARSGLPPMPRADVLGTRLALTDYEGAMDWIDEVVRRGERACVTAAAVHLVMVAREDRETRRAVDASLAVPDGVPLVWALRALGHDAATRVYGPDLMAAYCERSARTGTTMYLYGGRSEAALEQLTSALLRRYPGLRIVGGGAAFDFHAGIVPQAPAWMQRNGLEWTYRLAREPRRLWRRYARYNPRFVAAFARQYAAHRAGR